jgi:ribosomal protein L21
MTFAVFSTGGKQYIAEEGKKLKIEKIKGDFKVGDSISFTEVLLSVNGDDVKVGGPLVAGAEVKAEIIKIARAPKVIVLKYKQKSRYQKKNGHRQHYFEVKITSVK